MNSDGTCTGQRTCDPGTGRFSDCSAAVPQQLPECSSPQPTGCTEATAPSAISTVTDCGSCGNVCPGNGNATDMVTCNAQEQCTLACVGENYDVDQSAVNGCEVPASPQGDHTTSSRINLGSSDCLDGDSQFSISGRFPSDARTHQSPAVTGFDSSTGSAPDYWVITGTGSSFPSAICVDDLQLTVTLTGSSNPACYQVTVTSSYGPMTATFTAAGQALINQSDNQNYNDGDVITIELSKICSTPPEAPTFSSSNGHL